jgi:transcription antitermination factor NusG
MEVAYRIRQRAQQRPGLVENAVACFKHVASPSASNSFTTHTYERIIPSYVFVSVKALTGEVYHLLRSVPGIFKIFTTPISDTEMQRVFELMEAQVEVSSEDAEEKARQFRKELRKVWERLRQIKVQAQKYYRGLREFIRVPSWVLEKALSLIPPARKPDPLTVLCLLVT